MAIPSVPATTDSKQTIGGLLCLVLFLAIIHFAKLGHSPAGFYIDESAIGYNAYCLATTGADEYGTKWPLFFRCFDNYHDPVMVYILTPLVSALGLTKAVVRLPSAVFHVLAALALIPLARLYRVPMKIALTAALAFGTLPWVFPISRIMMSGYTAMLFGMALGSYALMEAVLRRRMQLAVVAGVSWAFAMYAHNVGRPMTALMLVCFCLAFNIHLWRRWRVFAAFIAAYVLSLMPMIMSVLGRPDALTSRFKRISVWHDDPTMITILGRMAGRYWEYFSPYYLWWQGDANLRHHTGHGGVLFFTLAPFVLIGAWQLGKRLREPACRFLMLCVLVYPAAAILTIDHRHSTRCINGSLFLCVVAAVGAAYAWRRPGWPRKLVAVAAVVGAMEVGYYLNDYFGDYVNRSREAFGAPFTEAVAAAFAEMEAEETLYVSGSVFFRPTTPAFKPYMYAHLLFFGAIPPEDYQGNGFPSERVSAYTGRIVRPGILMRCNSRAKRMNDGRWLIMPNPESIPPGAALHRQFPLANGMLYQLFRVRPSKDQQHVPPSQ